MFCGYSGVLTAARCGLRLAYVLDLTAFLDLIMLWTLFGPLDYDWITMVTDFSAMDLDSPQNCSTCKARMSSLMHDSHLICVNCRGRGCSLDNRCVECEGWSEEVMKHVKYRKSLDSKSKSKMDKKISASSDQASLPFSRDSNMSQASAASAGISEARVAELIAMQLGEFSSSFAATMQASFENFRSFIDDRFLQENQLEPNFSVPDSSPVSNKYVT